MPASSSPWAPWRRRWKKLDPTLRWLAVQATGMQIGCSWCVDYGYYEGMHHGIDPAKVRAVGSWRTSDLFEERERVVLEYAETATGSPAEVSEELAVRDDRGCEDGDLGLRSQGFSDNCEIPMRTVTTDAVA